ncbi:MAG: hypothetical protein GVY30_12385 [Chloroflexi bacterium]|jgi:TM2 domain-containing membrane protein YozV|nr:hypothetical protein [Chloroflexota bacterium]
MREETDIVLKVRYISAIVLAFVAPGLGRAMMGKIIKGVLLYIMYDILAHLFVIIEPHWMGLVFNFALWLSFGLRDLKCVRQLYVKKAENW